MGYIITALVAMVVSAVLTALATWRIMRMNFEDEVNDLIEAKYKKEHGDDAKAFRQMAEAQLQAEQDVLLYNLLLCHVCETIPGIEDLMSTFPSKVPALLRRVRGERQHPLYVYAMAKFVYVRPQLVQFLRSAEKS